MEVAARRLHSVALNVEPAHYLAGWRPADGVIFLPALGGARVGDEVAARVGLFGHTTRATLFGSISLVRRVGRPTLPPGVELTLERRSLPAARFLALAARGEPVPFHERPPRWVLDRDLVARHAGAPVPVTLRNVSEGGCALVWPAPLPGDGDEVSLRLGHGLLAARVRAVVCWLAQASAGRPSVGLRVAPEGRAARRWRSLVAEAARGGGLPT